MVEEHINHWYSMNERDKQKPSHRRRLGDMPEMRSCSVPINISQPRSKLGGSIKVMKPRIIKTDNIKMGRSKERNISNKTNSSSSGKTSGKHNTLKIYKDKSLGSGAFAKVYVAKYRGKLVAVKIIDYTEAKDKLIRQFKRELDVIKILKLHPHPNIPKYYKIIDDKRKKRILIVMEWCRGGELKQYIDSGLDLSLIKNYLRQIVSGYLHLLSLNIIHRDIKSQNLMLSHDLTTVKIIDFGLSKVIESDMTRTELGTPAYMAPERYGRNDYNATSDIWSLGIIMYEMIYCVRPFRHCKTKQNLIETSKRPLNYPAQRMTANIPSESFDNSDCSTDSTDSTDSTVSTSSDHKQSMNVPRQVPLKMEIVPQSIIKLLKGMMNPDWKQRLDWSDLEAAEELTLDIEGEIKLENALEFYRNVRSKTIAKRAENIRKKIHSKSHSSTGSVGSADSMTKKSKKSKKSTEADQMFRMDFEAKKVYSDMDSDNSIEPEEQIKSVRIRKCSNPHRIPQDRPDRRILVPGRTASKAITIGIDKKGSDFMAESICDVRSASVDDREIQSIEEYLMMNDPGFFSLCVAGSCTSIPDTPEKKEESFLSIAALDDLDFLNDSYEPGDRGTMRSIKKSSQLAMNAIYSKSAPIREGFSSVIKKMGKAIGNTKKSVK